MIILRKCICGLALAVTDLLQSVQLDYHGYDGEGTGGTKGATQEQVTNHLNGLFSLVQGLGGTAVVRTYIDQLAQVLSALVGWSKIVICDNNGDQCNVNGKKHHGQDNRCTYLEDVKENTLCDKCNCMIWDVAEANQHEKGHYLGRGCQRCSSDSGTRCSCGTGGGSDICTADSCKCAKEGKCCKCCCKGCTKCSDKCSCIEKDTNDFGIYIHKETYQSAYISFSNNKHFEQYGMTSTWKSLMVRGTAIYGMVNGGNSSSQRRHQCARILLGSVCLIWSGLTYMYWTGKYAGGSPRWNNHILDGNGLDDGTLSQWLQALGFPRDMLNNSGPQNRLDKVIWDGFRDKFFLGFLEPNGLSSSGEANDKNGNTARNPFNMNYAGFVHTIHRDSFNDSATVFNKNGTDTSSSNTQINDTDQDKNGAIFKLYILSCAYFTGLQKKATESTTHSTTSNTPKTIREILYWLSALPYNQAYPEILKHGKERLEKVLEHAMDKKLKFIQTGLNHPITVDEYNLFAHFQAVTQYCPLVLIGIQGGIHNTTGTDKSPEPAIHSLYANTECSFTYPTVPIQAYNQVVHYIRGLFYQLYFLRKQCAVKVAMGGKWRECRYGSGVLGKGVVSWMCLGCDPMEHDRKGRVENMGNKLNKLPLGSGDSVAAKLKEVLEAIGDVVVQLGNAQEALEGKKKEAIQGVIEQLRKAKEKLVAANTGLDGNELTKTKAAIEELTGKGSGSIESVTGGEGLGKATSDKKEFDPGKNRISEVIHKVKEVLTVLEKAVNDPNQLKGRLSDWVATEFTKNKKELISICNSPKCAGCKDHKDKCGRQGVKKTCDKCHQQYMDGFPSPLQAFLDDRLPGFSCDVVRNSDSEQPYPPAASHLEHCGGSGQCCPLPMGFRNQFCSGSISDSTGARLYGILYFFSNENMMQSCVYTLVRVTAALSATTPQVLGDVFGFFRGGVGNKEKGKPPKGTEDKEEDCGHIGSASEEKYKEKYFCGWCASGLRDEVKQIEWIPKGAEIGGQYRSTVGQALIKIKGDKDSGAKQNTTTSLSALTKNSEYLSPLTGELYTAVSATFGNTYLSWVLYLSDALEGGLKSLSDAFQQIECRGCIGCDPNKCKKGEHGQYSGQCGCQSIVSCTGVLPVLYRHGFSYGNPFYLEGYQQGDGKDKGDYSIERVDTGKKQCHQFLESLQDVIRKKEEETSSKGASQNHPLTELLKQVGKLQYDIRLPWIFVLTVAWLVAVLYLAFGAIWPLDWTHMRSHCRGWFRKGSLSPWEILMVGKKKGRSIVEFFGGR